MLHPRILANTNMEHVLNVIKQLLEFEDVKTIRIEKTEDGKVEIWDGDKYTGRHLIKHS